MAGFKPLLCKVRHLISLESKPLQIGAGAVVERRDLVGIGQFAIEIVGVNWRAVLGGERVHGDVRDTLLRSKVDRFADIPTRLPLQSDHDICTLIDVAEQAAGFNKICRGVPATELLKLRIDRRLQPDGKAVDARPLVGSDFLRRNGARVHLDGNFGIRRERVAGANLIHAPDDPLRVDHRGSPSADIHGIESFIFQFCTAEFHLLIDARHVSIGKADLPGVGSKIAVAALRCAKRNVDVDPCHINLSSLLGNYA